MTCAAPTVCGSDGLCGPCAASKVTNMKRKPNFEVEVRFSLESDREHTLSVTGFQQPYYPANLKGHPDSWTPAEGGELEDLEIRCVYGTKSRRIPPKLHDKLEQDDSFNERVAEAIRGE